ncbi:MAG TPA: T9SS type A sorting domain-containing protein [Candidatus Latescibacteria bacterium]|nr:T9SS type A sorting domain-containing protein [Candidatus Latescibacterota bacterium]
MVVRSTSTLTAMLILLVSSQSIASKVKTWTQTSVEDFSRGILNNAIVRNASGGEIELPHPMRKVIEDHKDNSIPRFISRDSEGNYTQIWGYRTKGVYIQRYGADGNPLGDPILVTRTYVMSVPFVATHLNGNFLVVWAASGDNEIRGRLYDPQGAVITDLRVNDRSGEFRNSPTVFVNSDSEFWVLWEEWFYGEYGPKYSDIYAQRYTSQGQRIGNNFEIDTGEITSFKLQPAVATDRDGNFALAWVGGDEAYSNANDVFVRRFSKDGQPLGPPIKVNDGRTRDDNLMVPDVCFGADRSFLVVWTDSKSNDGASVVGQYYDPDGIPRGSNFKIAQKQENGFFWRPDVFTDDQGRFWVTWHYVWAKEPDIYANAWKYLPVTSGTFVSRPFDTGPAGTDYLEIRWSGKTLPDTTFIMFKIRSTSSLEELRQAAWYGPSDTSGYYTDPSGGQINPIHDGDRYVQLKAFLSSSAEGWTPVLEEVSISYVSADSTPPTAPLGLVATPGHSEITLKWQPNAEDDLMMYRIYRGLRSGIYDSTWTKETPSGETNFTDTSAVTGTTYYYVVTAVDSALNESRPSEEASAQPYGVNLYVDDDGLATGDGTFANPFIHIQDAIDAAVYGDTVRVAAGVYRESIVMKPGVVILGAGAEVCEIISADSSPTVVAADGVISGFSIRLANPEGVTIRSIWSSPVITDNIITGGGIWCSGGFPIISKNIISDAECGIIYRSYRDGVVYVSNNIIFDVNMGIKVEYTERAWMINNILYLDEDARSGALRASMSSIYLANNIIVHKGPQGYGIWVDDGGHFEMPYSGDVWTKILYNNIWTKGKDIVGCGPTEGNISADPLFVNPNRGDFRLRPDSPCRDAGDPDPRYDDIDGTRNDMGAYGGPDPIRLGIHHPGVSLKIPSVSAFPGDTISVPVELDNAAGLAEASVEVHFDPDWLFPLYAKTTKLTSEFSLKYDVPSPGTISFSLSCPTELLEGSGPIAEIFFVADPSACCEETGPLEPRKIRLFDGAGSRIVVRSVTDGVFVIRPRSSSERLIYVDQNAVGEGDGSWARPFGTIGEGLAAADRGDTVLVAAGVYRERIRMKSGVTLKGSGALTTRIEMKNDPRENLPAISLDKVSDCTITGFELVLESDLLAPAIECISSSPLIKRNKITILGPGVAIRCRDSSDARIEDNLIDAETGLAGGISCESSDPIITRNRIRVGDGAAIICGSGSPLVRNNDIRVNGLGCAAWCVEASRPIFANNLIRSPKGKGQGIVGRSSSYLTVLNNVIMGTLVGIHLWPGSSASVRNNIILDNRGPGRNGSGIYVDEGASCELFYNNFWDNDTDCFRVEGGEGNLRADPLFVDPGVGDFRLKEGSPCVDAGDPDPKYNDPDGSRNDMGIYGGPYADAFGRFILPAKISLPDTSAPPGDTLSIPVEIIDAPGIAEVRMVLTYPPESFSVLDVRTTETSRAFSLTTEAPTEGEVRISMSSPAGVVRGTEPLLDITLVVDASAEMGSEGEIAFKEVVLLDDLAGEVSVSDRSPGKIRIVPPAAVEWDGGAAVPSDFALSQNYPNPFNLSTTIPFSCPEAKVNLVIYDLLGRKVRTLVNGKLEGGKDYRVTWDGRDELGREVSSGIYLYRIDIDEGKWVKTKKMVLIR